MVPPLKAIVRQMQPSVLVVMMMVTVMKIELTVYTGVNPHVIASLVGKLNL